MQRNPLVLTFLLVALATLSGCTGGNTIWITGRLLKGGTPYVPPKDQVVTITFVAMEIQDVSGKTATSGDPYQAEYDPGSGTFSVPGPEKRAFPRGSIASR